MKMKAQYYIWAFNCVQDVRVVTNRVWNFYFSCCLQTLCNNAIHDW